MIKRILSIFLSLFLLLLFAVPVFADESDDIAFLDSELQNGLCWDSDGEIRYYVDGVPTYAGVVLGPDGYYYYINSLKKAVKNSFYTISRTNDLIEPGSYFIDEKGHIVDPLIIFPEPDELYYLERIYILLFVIAGFVISGIFISRPRRWT